MRKFVIGAPPLVGGGRQLVQDGWWSRAKSPERRLDARGSARVGCQRVSLVLVYAQVGAQPYCYGLRPPIGLSDFTHELHEAILP